MKTMLLEDVASYLHVAPEKVVELTQNDRRFPRPVTVCDKPLFQAVDVFNWAKEQPAAPLNESAPRPEATEPEGVKSKQPDSTTLILDEVIARTGLSNEQIVFRLKNRMLPPPVYKGGEYRWIASDVNECVRLFKEREAASNRWWKDLLTSPPGTVMTPEMVAKIVNQMVQISKRAEYKKKTEQLIADARVNLDANATLMRAEVESECPNPRTLNNLAKALSKAAS